MPSVTGMRARNGRRSHMPRTAASWCGGSLSTMTRCASLWVSTSGRGARRLPGGWRPWSRRRSCASGAIPILCALRGPGTTSSALSRPPARSSSAFTPGRRSARCARAARRSSWSRPCRTASSCAWVWTGSMCARRASARRCTRRARQLQRLKPSSRSSGGCRSRLGVGRRPVTSAGASTSRAFPGMRDEMSSRPCGPSRPCRASGSFSGPGMPRSPVPQPPFLWLPPHPVNSRHRCRRQRTPGPRARAPRSAVQRPGPCRARSSVSRSRRFLAAMPASSWWAGRWSTLTGGVSTAA